DIARFCFDETMSRIRNTDAFQLLLSLALFEGDVSRTMLGEVAGIQDDEIGRDDRLAELLQLSLANQEADRFSLLPLTRSYVLAELAQQPALEQLLRDRWIQRLTALARPFATCYWQLRNSLFLLHEGPKFIQALTWSREAERPDTALGMLPAVL